MLNACTKSPFVNDITDRVEPQEGQGKCAMDFIKQTSNELSSLILVRYIQTYPIKHNVVKSAYSLILLRDIKAKLVKSAPYSLLSLLFESKTNQ